MVASANKSNCSNSFTRSEVRDADQDQTRGACPRRLSDPQENDAKHPRNQSPRGCNAVDCGALSPSILSAMLQVSATERSSGSDLFTSSLCITSSKSPLVSTYPFAHTHHLPSRHPNHLNPLHPNIMAPKIAIVFVRLPLCCPTIPVSNG